MDVEQLLVICYVVVIGGTVAVELILRHLDRADKKDKENTDQDEEQTNDSNN